ncbi:hypothetical protein K0M31_001839 [Melipona bicolor]|uniref:Uncharacterized protein n=1 Tax=Melipona bicolor TaxID=60889 RepID=A0AA40KYI8_9HYME|nr:hypothetical protein K0M31_001839 [Melipona bicolor]
MFPTRHGPHGRGAGIRPASAFPTGNYQLAQREAPELPWWGGKTTPRVTSVDGGDGRLGKTPPSTLKYHRSVKLSHTGGHPLSPFTRNFPKVLHE